MTNRWLALPTRSVEVERTFSLPQPSTPSSSFRTSRSMVAVTSTSNFPAASGVPESVPVSASSLSQLGPFKAYLGCSMSQKLGDFRLVLPQVAQGAIGGDLAAVLRAHLGL